MARPSNIDKLPEDVRAELHSELSRTNFTGYEWLSLWLGKVRISPRCEIIVL